MLKHGLVFVVQSPTFVLSNAKYIGYFDAAGFVQEDFGTSHIVMHKTKRRSSIKQALSSVQTNTVYTMSRAQKKQTATKTFSFGIRPVSQDLRELPELSTPLGSVNWNNSAMDNGARKKLMLPTMEGISFEKIKNILYLEASGNYTLIHFTDGRQTLVCRSLCEIENKLPKNAFVRIHRSHTVHLSHLKKYVRGKGGHVILHNGVLLAVSSGQKDHFLKMLEDYFG